MPLILTWNIFRAALRVLRGLNSEEVIGGKITPWAGQARTARVVGLPSADFELQQLLFNINLSSPYPHYVVLRSLCAIAQYELPHCNLILRLPAGSASLVNLGPSKAGLICISSSITKPCILHL